MLDSQAIYDIYALITKEQKALACSEISSRGPLVAASSSPLVFSISRIPVAAGLLFDVFEDIGVSCVAVVVFGMKDGSYMHNITDVPISPNPLVSMQAIRHWHLQTICIKEAWF